MQVENVLLLEVCVCISFYFLQDVMCTVVQLLLLLRLYAGGECAAS